jgi:hypothetical protein
VGDDVVVGEDVRIGVELVVAVDRRHPDAGLAKEPPPVLGGFLPESSDEERRGGVAVGDEVVERCEAWIGEHALEPHRVGDV